MADRKYYVICEQNCKFESMTKEQILTAIMQAVESGEIKDVDTGFVTTIQTVNGKAVKFFYGQQSEYEALTDAEKENLFAIITNDTTEESIRVALEALNSKTDGIEETVSNVADDLESTKSEVAKVKSDLSSAKSSLSSAISSAQNDISSLENEVDDCARMIRIQPNNLSVEDFPIGTLLMVALSDKMNIGSNLSALYLPYYSSGLKYHYAVDNKVGADLVQKVINTMTTQSTALVLSGTWKCCGCFVAKTANDTSASSHWLGLFQKVNETGGTGTDDDDSGDSGSGDSGSGGTTTTSYSVDCTDISWGEIQDEYSLYDHKIEINGTEYSLKKGELEEKIYSGVSSLRIYADYDTSNSSRTGAVSYSINGGTETRLTGGWHTIALTGSGNVKITATEAYTCLTGDTLITMADGTQKRIDEMKVGDSVKSINPETLEIIADTVTFSDADENNVGAEFDVWKFEDGTIVKTVHRHRLYNIERQCMTYMDEWEIGEHAYNESGEAVALMSHERVSESVKHYTIFTNHQNYFANGLLSGNRYTKGMKLA